MQTATLKPKPKPARPARSLRKSPAVVPAVPLSSVSTRKRVFPPPGMPPVTILDMRAVLK
jgi:hypothetical protein